MEKITIEALVQAPLEKVWTYWTEPAHIPGWAFASDDWEANDVENDVREGGSFKTHMQAKDGSAGFDFTGTYTDIEEAARIAYVMDDARQVETTFTETPDGVQITQTFDPESENTPEMQRAGWQAILNNFKAYAERTA